MAAGDAAADAHEIRRRAGRLHVGGRGRYVASALKQLGLSRREELASVVLPVDVPSPASGEAVRLTLRQGQVAALVAAGASNAEIAAALGISEKTVDKHMTVIKERTGVSTRTALVALFRTTVAAAPAV